jgi:photosystem II stability/assembly factor-like uncharacterized protein
VRAREPATRIATTTLATLLLAALAYVSVTGALHLQRVALRPAGSPSASPTPAPSAPSKGAPSPIPSPVMVTPPNAAGLAVISADFIDSFDGWVLLTSCAVPGAAQCHYATANTSDGGATWTRPVQVGPLVAATDGGAPRSIRFLNSIDGFAYGGTGAFATHDAGKSWTMVAIKATFINEIAVSAGTVWAITYPCAKGTLCAYEVRSSLDGGRTWSAAHALPTAYSPDVADAFPYGLVLSDVPLGDIQMTSDRGATWHAIKTPCTSNPFRGEATTPDGRELWEVCTAYPGADGTPGPQTLFVSEDAGQSWSQRHAFPQPGMWNVVSNQLHVAFSSANQATFASHDSGVTWLPVSSQNVTFTTIRFGTAQWGWALDDQRNVWTTADGGVTWQEGAALPNTLA